MASATAPKGSSKFAYDLYKVSHYSLETFPLPTINTINGAFPLFFFQNCVAEKGGNVIISPVSVETALSMVYMGAKGTNNHAGRQSD